jgi:hypothetical protein
LVLLLLSASSVAWLSPVALAVAFDVVGDWVALVPVECSVEALFLQEGPFDMFKCEVVAVDAYFAANPGNFGG